MKAKQAVLVSSPEREINYKNNSQIFPVCLDLYILEFYNSAAAKQHRSEMKYYIEVK